MLLLITRYSHDFVRAFFECEALYQDISRISLTKLQGRYASKFIKQVLHKQGV